MKHQLLFATNNLGKLQEVQALMPADLELKGLEEAGITEDIPETGQTLEENALIKARYAAEKCGLPTFADDTGLEVEALGGAPGVYSARYATPEKDPAANMARLLEELSDQHNRRARFRTVIAWVWGQESHTFEGIAPGEIIEAPRGAGGFGYDPIFRPQGFEETFAEMALELKNRISHRAQAMQHLSKFLAEKFTE